MSYHVIPAGGELRHTDICACEVCRAKRMTAIHFTGGAGFDYICKGCGQQVDGTNFCPNCVCTECGSKHVTGAFTNASGGVICRTCLTDPRIKRPEGLPRSPTVIYPTMHPPENGLRSNAGKPRHELISPWAMGGLAAVLTFGATRYSKNNWRKGLSWAETLGSLKRHIAEFEKGIDTDPDSGLPHIDHALCNVVFLSEFQKLNRGTDDRWKP